MQTMLEETRSTRPPTPVKIGKILVPFDFSEPAQHALDFGQQLATTFGATVEVLYVVPHLPASALPIELGSVPMSSHTLEDLVADAEKRLRDALGSEEEAGAPKKTVKVGDPRAQIVAHAAAEDVDLIVMGTHGRKGAARFLLGSVAERVVREAGCPVLTLH